MFSHIRYRFDKSPRNYTVRKYGQRKSFLCPVKATMSIILRSQQLKVPSGHPVGVSVNRKNKLPYDFLKSEHIIKLLRSLCVRIFPDENHYFRQHISDIVAHSLRVTAAVALKTSGADIPDIAFRLRWTEDSVQHYSRECSDQIDNLTRQAMAGALGIK